jgi:hypothetical protein
LSRFFPSAIEGTLINIVKNNPLARTFSFRQEFSNDFHRLSQQALNQTVTKKIQNKHFPFFMNGRNMKVSKAKLVLLTPAGQTVNNFEVILNGTAQNAFSRDASIGDLFSADLGNIFNAGFMKDAGHILQISKAGDLALTTQPSTGIVPAVDTEKLQDIILWVEYKVS